MDQGIHTMRVQKFTVSQCTRLAGFRASTKVPDLQRVEGSKIPELPWLQGSRNPQLQVSTKLQDFRVLWRLQGSKVVMSQGKSSKLAPGSQGCWFPSFSGFQGSRIPASIASGFSGLYCEDVLTHEVAPQIKRKMQTNKAKLKQNPQVLLWFPERFLQDFLKGIPARYSCNAFLQGIPARQSCKAILQGLLGFLQRFRQGFQHHSLSKESSFLTACHKIKKERNKRKPKENAEVVFI